MSADRPPSAATVRSASSSIRRRGRHLRAVRRRRVAACVCLLGVGAAALIASWPRGAPRARQLAAVVVSVHHSAHPREAAPLRPAVRRAAAAVPILMYHVIAPPPPGAPYPGLYVPRAEFAAQMAALARAGYHAVTLDEVRRSWLEGTALPPRPLVLTFDNGYRTQYTAALPVLRRLHWVADENLQLSGLPPSQGGLSAREVRALVRAGWELDTQGYSHANLTDLDPAQLRFQIGVARATIRRRYHVKADWFCYPSGLYDPVVVAAVKAAGFVGSTTVIAGWAVHSDDAYTLPRLRVLGGTTPAALLSLIVDTRDDPPPPSAYLAG